MGLRAGILLTALFFLATAASIAQTGRITGTVFDADHRTEPLISAVISIEGINRRAVSDVEGKFVIDSLAMREYTLHISYIGHQFDSVRVLLVGNSLVELKIGLKEQVWENVVIHGRPTPTISNSPSRKITLGEFDSIMLLYGLGPWD